MDFSMGEAATTLRTELRELVAERVPADFLGAFSDDPADLETAQRFCRVLAERGLLCLAWPEEFGGRGASAWEQTVVREEMWAHHEPRGAQYMGVNWVGPAIMRHGTEQQQRKHLPAIARGEVIWCQGFSEPDAGSDLASLRTAARRVTEDSEGGAGGAQWRVYGQKIWTSYALMAQWCFLLARTSTGEKKQHGLTVFLVPMSSPGIEVRPIRSMLGPHHLNEVFFDGLRVTQADVLGTVDQGWAVVQEVLAFERVGIARYARCERLLQAAPAVLGEGWDALPAELRGRWARMLVQCRRARLLAYRVVSLQSQGRVTPGDSAAYRIAVTRLDQDSAEVLTEIAACAPERGWPADRFRAEVQDHWRYSQASTVASGSIEVQRILLARSMLRGPGKPQHATGQGPPGGHPRSPVEPVPVDPAKGAMNIDLSEEAAEYGRQALRALEAAGGDRLVQQAEQEPERREAIMAPVLGELGAWELDARGDAGELEAAAALCRSAGYWAMAYPLAERLSRPADLDADGLVVVADHGPAAAVAGVDLRWAAVTLSGRRSRAVAREPDGPPRIRAFVTALDLEQADGDGAGDVALGLALPCWTLLGMLDRAIDLTRAHVLVREQFGQPLADFQAVQFQLTDAEVERSGLEMLAGYALWSIQAGRDDALDDALALRLAAVEAADTVFRVAHQLHGAIGFCDEAPLSWVSRYSQPLRRLPLGLSATREALTSRIGRRGLTGLFSDAS